MGLHAACLAVGYGLVYHVDALPEWARLRLQQWLGKNEHERPAPTSKLIAYHLEIWFSDNRRAQHNLLTVGTRGCQALASTPYSCQCSICMFPAHSLVRNTVFIQGAGV
jgi:hypothetical protein